MHNSLNQYSMLLVKRVDHVHSELFVGCLVGVVFDCVMGVGRVFSFYFLSLEIIRIAN